MDLGKVETCAHCGKQFKAFLDKHDEQDCIDGLREENARLVEERQAAWECAKRTRHERDEARAEAKRYHDALVARHGGEPVALLEQLDASRAEVARLEGLILDWESEETQELSDEDEDRPSFAWNALLVEACRIRVANGPKGE